VNAFEKSIKYLEKGKSTILNLGSGKGMSVKEIFYELKKFFFKKNKQVDYVIHKNKRKDKSFLVCTNSKAKKLLKWNLKFSDINQIIKDEYLWKKKCFVQKGKI